MTQREREQTVRRHLYRYAQYVREVRRYEQSIFGSPQTNETGIRGSNVSDPTARSGIALADPPKTLERKRRWIIAVDSAMDELSSMDGGDERGYVFICTHVFGLDGHRNKCRANRDSVLKIACDCNLSVRALYGRISTIINTVIFYATGLRLFDEEKK